MSLQEYPDTITAWSRQALLALAQAEPYAFASAATLGWNLTPTREKARQQQRYNRGLHRHPYLELCVTVRGQGMMDIEDQRFRMEEPAMVLLNPGVFHSEGFDHKKHSYGTLWFSWTGKGIRVLANAYQPVTGWSCPWTTMLPAQHQHRLARWTTGLFDAAVFEPMRATLLAVLGEMMYQEQMRPGQEDVRAGHARVLRWVRHYLDGHYAEPLNVEHVAEMTCYSPHYLNALFAQWTGHGIRTYLIRRRMEQALSLCQETDLPIQDIAAKVGYDDPLYFSRAFRRYHGYPPSGARKEAT